VGEPLLAAGLHEGLAVVGGQDDHAPGESDLALPALEESGHRVVDAGDLAVVAVHPLGPVGEAGRTVVDRNLLGIHGHGPRVLEGLGGRRIGPVRVHVVDPHEQRLA
jgi:hypothetical protein